MNRPAAAAGGAGASGDGGGGAVGGDTILTKKEMNSVKFNRQIVFILFFFLATLASALTLSMTMKWERDEFETQVRSDCVIIFVCFHFVCHFNPPTPYSPIFSFYGLFYRILDIYIYSSFLFNNIYFY